MKKAIIAIVIIIIVIAGGYFFFKNSANDTGAPSSDTSDTTQTPLGDDSTVAVQDKTKTVIGKSAEGRDIVAYHYGNLNGAVATGTSETSETKDILFVGGIHGGYEWNTSLVAYQTMEYLEKTPGIIPENVRVTIVPVLNPDGLNRVLATPFVASATGFSAADVSTSKEKQVEGRFNGNEVDLNRNFDCDWQSVGKWQDKDVSGGTAPFSEPESLAMKNYIETDEPDAVVVWYSAAGGVFASSCHNGVSAETRALTKTFAEASGYKAYENFDFYEITGDMVNWLAKKNVPAISVLLTNHTDTEWSKNKLGIEAVLKYIAK